MTPADRSITFREREFKGSRLRCLLLTNNAPDYVADFLNSLVAPHAIVMPEDHWAPRGFLDPDEAKLGETLGFLCEPDRTMLTSWWLAQPGRANTPNWDLMSTCRIEDRRGLILAEAKAHEAEFSDDRSGAKNPENIQQIENALAEATVALNALASGFALTDNTHYQLSNRFAFAWKVAKMGTPVVLLYLGFLDAQEMEDGSRILLKDHAQWRRCLLARSKGTIPEEVWDRTFDVNGTPLTILIGSAVVGIHARSASDRASSV
jgi:hypothetical protein